MDQGYSEGYEAYRGVFLVTHVIPLAAIVISLIAMGIGMITRNF